MKGQIFIYEVDQIDDQKEDRKGEENSSLFVLSIRMVLYLTRTKSGWNFPSILLLKKQRRRRRRGKPSEGLTSKTHYSNKLLIVLNFKWRKQANKLALTMTTESNRPAKNHWKLE